jgi:hypothetical protein
VSQTREEHEMGKHSENARDRIAEAAEKIRTAEDGDGRPGYDATPAEKKADAIRRTTED